MAIKKGIICTDAQLQNGIYPYTQVDCVFDENGTSLEDLLDRATETRVLTLEIASFSSLPQTISNAKINSNMVVLNSVLGTPNSQTGDWTVTTNNGSLTISGSISGSTTLTLYLMEQRS